MRKGFTFRECTLSSFETILSMQEKTLAALPDKEILRRNTPEMLKECLTAPNVTLGAWDGDRLAAFSVLYFPHNQEEDLSLCLEGVDTEGLKAANYKLCIVDEDYRGNSLQYQLAMRLERYALSAGVRILCSTASPNNLYSTRNIRKAGYTLNRTLEKYGFQRELYYKFI